MSSYAIKYEPGADEQLGGINDTMLDVIKRKVEWLALNAGQVRHQALKGKEYKHLYKLRVGDYRIVYLVSHGEKLITVREIGHRSKIYKER